MSSDVYSDEPWLSIRWDPEHRCVYAEFKGFANSAEFRASATKILDAIREKRAHLLISDNRGLEALGDEDQLWIRDTWTPLAVTAGVKRIGVVLAPTGLGRFVSQQIMSRIGNVEFVTRSFDSPAEAIEWIGENEKKT
jgi:hypothetical protein